MKESRWLAIFLPRLATDRLIRAGRAPEGRPLATYAKQANAFLLTGVDSRASELGLRLAISLADARAIRPDLAVIEAEPGEDARLLDAIAGWCERFTPIVVLDPPDGLFLDITGCAHLFGGEAALQSQIVTRLQAQGFASRAEIAPTPGAAWALARYGCNASGISFPPPRRGRGRGGGESVGRNFAKSALISRGISASGEAHLTPPPDPSPSRGGEEFFSATLGQALSPLPIEALRLEESSASLLRRLGLKTIGQLIAAPRLPFTARAGQAAMLRLDQALGRAPEALTPRRPPPPVFALRRFLEPLFTLDAVLEVTQKLCADVVEKLDRNGAGARRAELHLFGVDGRDRVIEIGISRPERDAKALLRLFREKLNVVAENLDTQFGLEAARLDVVQMQRLDAQARTLVAVEEAAASAEKIAALVDVLSARLGPTRVLRPKLNDAHAPERAGGWRAALVSSPARGGSGSREARDEGGGSPLSHAARDSSPASGGANDSVMRRPLSMFARAQPIEAIAAVPDGPPIRFRWRRVLREVARAEGPERICGDWLGHGSRGAPVRDYYRVEDRQGRRYWLYREGLFGDDIPPRWFVQGLFA